MNASVAIADPLYDKHPANGLAPQPLTVLHQASGPQVSAPVSWDQGLRFTPVTLGMPVAHLI